jgi:DNA-binding transcriptional MerR regulator
LRTNDMSTGLLYPIASAARLAGLSIDTIRAWERRHAAVVPERGARGRVYTEAQIERLRRLSALARVGHTIGDIAGLADSQLEQMLERSHGVPAGAAAAGRPPEPSPVARIIDAIDRFDQPAADREVARLAALHVSRTLVHEVALPLMREAGNRWHRGVWSAAQEHMLSAILRAVVAGIARLESTPDAAPRLVFATPEGELHEFGILAAAMLASAARLGIVYLGASLPADEIAEASERVGAAAAVIGITGGSAAAIRELRTIRRLVRAGTEVWAGGPAGLRSRVGAGARKRLVLLESFDEYERHLNRVGGR